MLMRLCVLKEDGLKNDFTFSGRVSSDQCVDGMASLSASLGLQAPCSTKQQPFLSALSLCRCPGPSLVAASRDYGLVVVSGLLSWSTGSVVAHFETRPICQGSESRL